MCTVGYGDFFARTHIGRCISVLACFWGIFNITLMVVTLTNYTAFSKGETRAYNYLARTSALDNAKIHAAKFIRASYQRYLLIKIGGKKNQFLKERREKTYEMRIHYEKFKDYKKAAIFAEPTGEELLRTLYEALNIQLERIEGRLTQAKDLNDQVRTVEKSQRHTKEAIKSSIKLMETLEGFLIEKYQNNV